MAGHSLTLEPPLIVVKSFCWSSEVRLTPRKKKQNRQTLRN